MDKKNNIENEFDSFFQKGLENANFPAPEGVWENLASQISAPASPGSETIIQTISNASTIVKVAVITFTLAITTAAIVFFSNSEKNNETLKTEQVKTPNLIESEVIIESNQIDTDFSFQENEKQSQVEANESVINKTRNDKKTSRSFDKDPYDKELNTTILSENELIKSQTETINKLETIIEKPSSISNIEQVAKIITLKDTFVCDKTYQSNANYWGISGLKLNTKKISHSPIIISSQSSDGDIYQRTVRLKKFTNSVEVSNYGQNEIFAELKEFKLGYKSTWYINDEKIGTDVKEISYYRIVDFDNKSTQKLSIYLTDENQCLDTVQMDVTKYFEPINDPLIPNVFTPNHDGLNDFFEIKISGESFYSLKIYDKYNNLLFESKDKSKLWDGKDKLENEMQTGWFVYVFEYSFPDSEIQKRSGMIQLIRN